VRISPDADCCSLDVAESLFKIGGCDQFKKYLHHFSIANLAIDSF
jgi:hypothetical protein